MAPRPSRADDPQPGRAVKRPSRQYQHAQRRGDHVAARDVSRIDPFDLRRPQLRDHVELQRAHKDVAAPTGPPRPNGDQPRGRDRRIPVRTGLFHARLGVPSPIRAPGIVAAVGDHRPAVIGALAERLTSSPPRAPCSAVQSRPRDPAQRLAGCGGRRTRFRGSAPLSPAWGCRRAPPVAWRCAGPCHCGERSCADCPVAPVADGDEKRAVRGLDQP